MVYIGLLDRNKEVIEGFRKRLYKKDWTVLPNMGVTNTRTITFPTVKEHLVVKYFAIYNNKTDKEPLIIGNFPAPDKPDVIFSPYIPQIFWGDGSKYLEPGDNICFKPKSIEIFAD